MICTQNASLFTLHQRPPCCSKHCYIATQWLNGHCSISLTCYNKENESCISSKQQAKLTQIQRQANRRTTKTSEQPHVLKWIRWIDRSPDRTRYINQSPEIPPHKPFKSGTSSNLGQQQSPDRTRHTNQSPYTLSHLAFGSGTSSHIGWPKPPCLRHSQVIYAVVPTAHQPTASSRPTTLWIIWPF